MNIAILGATSEIAQDLLREWTRLSRNLSIDLFARNVEQLSVFLKKINPSFRAKVYHISEFDVIGESIIYDGIINFVGVGDPSKARDMSSVIMGITFYYDDKVIKYLEKNYQCKYIFLSSGAAYGSDFTLPASIHKKATFQPNMALDSEKYALAKFFTEVKHRSLSHFNIFDVRVFNYFSRYQNMESRYFITDMLRSISSNCECVVSPEPMVRDYLHPRDFCQIIDCILKADKANMAVDCYSSEPIEKSCLLKQLEHRYGLKWKYSPSLELVVATGSKQNYYSEYHALASIGYKPCYSSLSGLFMEFDALLNVRQ